MSKLDANTLLMLGHSQPDLGGESVQVTKFSHLLNGQLERVVDIFSLFGEEYESLSTLNYALAEGGDMPLSDIAIARPFLKKIEENTSQTVLMLSWCFSLAALLATGIQNKRRLVSKFYVHHAQEKVFPALYSQADLLITESLLANFRGAAYGLPESKLLYFPHHYPEIALAPKPPSEEVVIGVVSRFERGKNCEYALEVVRKLVDKGERIKLILMGDFATHTSDPLYQKNFAEMLSAYEEAPWFSWERERKSYPDVFEAYNRFDLCLQLSGAEAGSNVVVELLGMGKPVIALDATTNPFLFKGGALLVKADPETYPGQLHYQVPDMEKLEESVEELVREAALRKEWGEKGKALAQKRFHVSVAQARLPLLFESDSHTLQKLYDSDRREYGF